MVGELVGLEVVGEAVGAKVGALVGACGEQARMTRYGINPVVALSGPVGKSKEYPV